MSELGHQAPVNGSCLHCGCRLGYAATRKDEAWFCCGACAGSDRCGCGCKPEFTADPVGDVFVPTRRMFASRAPDGLKTPEGEVDRQRAFPFSDKARGR